MKTKAGMALGLALCMAFVTYLYAADGTQASAARVPGVRELGSLSAQYDPVTFDHAKHASIAESCAACHHHGNGNTASCKECHALTPAAFKNAVVNNFMSCSSCHGSYDRDNPATPGLKVAYHKKCFACHRGMGNIGLDPKGCTEICHAKKSRPQ